MNDKLCKTVLRFRSHVCNRAARIRVKLTEGPTTWANIREGKLFTSSLNICTKVCTMLIHSFIQLKVWWYDATLFVYYLVQYIHSFHHIHTVHSSVTIRRSSSPSSHGWSAQWEKPPWGAEPRIKLGPASQQAESLPTELPNTLSQLCRTLTELRCILTERRRTLAELRRNYTEPPRYIISYISNPHHFTLL